MAKKILTLVLLFVACYLGAHYYLRWKAQNSNQARSPARLADCDANQVRGIRVLRKDGATIEVQRMDRPREGIPASAQLAFSEWRLKGDPEIEADSALATRIASMFCDLYDPVPDEAANLKESPTAVKGLELVVGESPGQIHRLEFGAFTSDRLNLVKYQAPAGEERTVRITPKLVQVASTEPRDFRNLKVLRMNGDLVQALYLREGKRERFSLEREGPGWMVRNNGKEIGKGSERAQQYVNRLGTLRALDVKPRGDTACDKLPAKLVIELQGVANRAETLYLDYGKAGPVRVCNTARDTIFEVHRDLIQYVDVTGPVLTN